MTGAKLFFLDIFPPVLYNNCVFSESFPTLEFYKMTLSDLSSSRVHSGFHSVLAAVAVAMAVLCLQGCALSRGAASENGWVGEPYVEDGGEMLPDAGDISVHEAAEAARAQHKAAPVVETVPAAPAPTPAPAAEAAPAPAAAPAPVAEAAPILESSALAAALAAADSTDDSEIFTNDEAKSRGNKFEPLIGQGYRLKIIVRVGDRDEVGPLEVMVSEKGDVSLPIVGRVQCDGLTINAFHSRLSGIFSEYFTDPDVEVNFAYSEDGISPYGQVLVQGRVHREGWVNIPPTRNLRLSHAIQRSGGFASSALRRKVLVLRRGDDGRLERHVIDFKAIGKNGELDNDILLEPNDVIYVDESNF